MMDEIILQNPWWKTKRIDDIKKGSIKRDDFSLIKKHLDDTQITCLIGARRVGKTTLMFNTIDHLLKNGSKPEEILYISLDSPKIRMHLKENFDEVFQQYSETILKIPLDQLKDTIYVFLDEVHKLDEWGDIIKYWQDLQLPIKFIVSGSSAIRIIKGSGESLLGRIKYITMYPLTFSEWTKEKTTYDFLNYTEIKKAYQNHLLHKQELLINLDEYLIKGGYPEIYDEKYVEHAYDTLRQYKTLTLTRDILDLKDIKEPRILEDLADLLSDFMSERINYSTFASTLKIKVDTVKKYLSYLEECFLTFTTYVYSTNHIISTRKEKKLFFIDHGLRNALLLKEIDDLEKTKIIENVVFTHVIQLKKHTLFPKMFYWLDQSKNEVDIILTVKENLIPIEVKYSNTIPNKKIKGLIQFLVSFQVEKGIVVTKDLLEAREVDGKMIYFIPAWLFLLNRFAPPVE